MDFYQIVKRIDPILDSPNPSQGDIDGVMHYVNDASILRYFLKRITSLKWFERLRESGFFRSLLSPPAQAESEPGFYSISLRSALDYLERVSRECGDTRNRQY